MWRVSLRNWGLSELPERSGLLKLLDLLHLLSPLLDFLWMGITYEGANQ